MELFFSNVGRPPASKMGADIAKLLADPAPFLLSFHSFTLTAVHRAQHLANYSRVDARDPRARVFIP
jgi:hypothetical protein